MTDMSNLQKLIDTHYNISGDDAKDVLMAAQEAEDIICFGVAAIGDLMYRASENKDFGEEAMRYDMLNIGLLLRCMGNFQAAIGATIENCKFSISQNKGKSAHDQ